MNPRTSIRFLLGAALAPALALSACGDDADTGPSTDTDLDASDAVDGSAASDAADSGSGADVADDSGADAQTDADAGSGEPAGIEIAGLTAPVTARFDQWGVPHLSCQTDPDCAAALGYLHARDRFAQMDLRRRVTTGRLTELVGSLALDNSVTNRGLFLTRDGRYLEQAALEYASPETLALLEAYSAGVNRWLAEVEAGTATLPDEYAYPLVYEENIPPWTPADSIAAVLALVNQLTNDSAADASYGAAWDQLGAERAFELYAPWQTSAATTIDGFTGPGDAKRAVTWAGRAELLDRARPALDEAYRRLRNAGASDDSGQSLGSNNWVVSPSQTVGGNTLFSNDPHLGMSNPSVWYLAHVDARTDGTGAYNAAGLTLAGLPWVIIGQNENIAWGGTVAYFDLADLYVETLSDDGEGVLFNGETVPFTEVDHTFVQADGEPVTRTLLVVPQHGPVIAIDREAGTAVTLRWTGHDLSTDVNFLTELMGAANVTEARDALSLVTTIGQNWVVSDTSGNIGWFPYNTVPLRPWSTTASGLYSWLPLPGDGTAEWSGYWDLADLPQAFNPERGWVATANSDMTGALYDGDPTNDGWSPLQTLPDQAYRLQRIQQLLGEGAGLHTLQTMQTIVSDTYLAWGAQLLPGWVEVLDAAELTGPGAAVLGAISDWNLTCPTGLATTDPAGAFSDDPVSARESIGCAAFSHLFYAARSGAFGDEFEQGEWVRFPGNAAFIRLDQRPDTFTSGADYWDDVTTEVVETRADVLIAAANAAGATLTETLGADPDGWRWGRVHTLTLAADLFSAFGIPNFDNGPHANDGNLWTVDVAAPVSPTSGDWSHASGASARLNCEGASMGMRCTIQLPGGQRHYRDSANYADLLELYLRNEPTDLLFGAADVAAGTVAELQFEPAAD